FSATQSSLNFTLSLHDALPIYFRSDVLHWQKLQICGQKGICVYSQKGCPGPRSRKRVAQISRTCSPLSHTVSGMKPRIEVSLMRSEEHTSELQSRFDLVCRLLL